MKVLRVIMMFLSEFKKILGRAASFLLLLCLLSGVALAKEVDPKNESGSIVYTHNKSSGGFSRDVITLTKPEELAAGRCALFDSAEIVYNNQRFVSAKIKSRPKKNCNAASGSCKVAVEAEYSPVGRLSYWILAKWKVKSSGC